MHCTLLYEDISAMHCIDDMTQPGRPFIKLDLSLIFNPAILFQYFKENVIHELFSVYILYNYKVILKNVPSYANYIN